MTVVILALVATIALVAFVAAVGLAFWSTSWVRRAHGQTIVVHTGGGGPSLRGVQKSASRHGVVLGAVELLDTETRLAGDVMVDRDRISFVQVGVPSPALEVVR